MRRFQNESVIYMLGPCESEIKEAIERFAKEKTQIRLWEKSPSLWLGEHQKHVGEEIRQRLGWLDLPLKGLSQIENLKSSSSEAKENFKKAVLLGMGGSSLAPLVFTRIFGNISNRLKLSVLDSTHPFFIKPFLEDDELRDTLFIVSSKSGGTIETICLFDLFYEKLSSIKENPEENFWIITDRGSKLEPVSKERGIKKLFYAPEDVGGRYSVFSFFGMLPGAVMGIDIKRAFEKGILMMNKCSRDIPFSKNPALFLGTTLGELSVKGKDKLILSGSIEIFPIMSWLEQLIAESTGKDSKGILPVPEKGLLTHSPAEDQVIVYFRLNGSSEPMPEETLNRLNEDGVPVIIIELNEIYDIFQEFYRWEMATAMAGAVLRINPFNQPDVELTKKRAKELINEQGGKAEMNLKSSIIKGHGICIYGLEHASEHINPSHALSSFLGQGKMGNYISIMGYLPGDPSIELLMEELRISVKEKTGITTTAGYGPRYLHSTGQLHKGGANKGIFLIIIHDPDEDIQIPGRGYGFKRLIKAQAVGDYLALKEKGREVIIIEIASPPDKGLKRLINSLKG